MTWFMESETPSIKPTPENFLKFIFEGGLIDEWEEKHDPDFHSRLSSLSPFGNDNRWTRFHTEALKHIKTRMRSDFLSDMNRGTRGETRKIDKHTASDYHKIVSQDFEIEKLNAQKDRDTAMIDAWKGFQDRFLEAIKSSPLTPSLREYQEKIYLEAKTKNQA